MPKAYVGGSHNGLEASMTPQDGRPVNDAGESLNKDGSVSKRQPNEGDLPSDGTSSLTSESTPDKSGKTSTTAHRLRAQPAESHSGKVHQSEHQSSTAASTAGSIHETGSGQASLQVSSVESPKQQEAAPDPQSNKRPGSK